MADEWNMIASVEDIDEGGTLATEMGDTEVCLYKVDGEVFATTNRCSHGEASLADGIIVDDFLIECPLHEGTFDIRTGAAVGAPCKAAIRCFDVQVKEGAIYLRLEQFN
jgi:nitrite reductase/ring-hydroxylating ferredoxin subunit